MKLGYVILSYLMFASLNLSAEVKVGFVDLQRAIQETTAGKKAKAELETEFSKKKKEFEKQDQELKKAGEELMKKKPVMSEEAFVKKQNELQEQVMRFRESVNQSQYEIQKKQQELSAPILEKIRNTINKIAKDKGYTMVAESGTGILYAEPNSDLTQEVIKVMESTEK